MQSQRGLAGATRPALLRVRPRPGGSLRHRLAILFALALLPPTALSAYLAWDAFHEQRERAKLAVRQLTALAGTYERKFFDGARDELQGIADQDVIQDKKTPACRTALTEALDQASEFAGLALYALEGEVVCTTSDTPREVAEHSWFLNVIQTRNFTISDYTLTGESSQPSIVAAVPVFDSSNDIVGVLSATIHLYWLDSFLREASLPSEGVFYLLDSGGNVLANSASWRGEADAALPKPQGGDANDMAGEGPKASNLVREDLLNQVASRGLGDFEAVGNDGVRRVYSSVALPHGDVTVLFGVPAHTMLGLIKQDLITRILSVAAIWLAGIAAAWVGTRHLVTRWTASLRRMALDYARGDYSAKLDLDRAPSELRDLGHSLMLMAQRIQDREGELRVSLDQKNMLLREVHHRVKNNLQTVASLLRLQAGAGEVDPRKALDDHDPAEILTMRSLAPDGSYDRPFWFEEYDGRPRVFFGHTVLAEPFESPSAVGLDTGCVYGGTLTAYHTGTGEFVTVEPTETYQERSDDSIVTPRASG
jgi:two-component sensor histidine kinase